MSGADRRFSTSNHSSGSSSRPGRYVVRHVPTELDWPLAPDAGKRHWRTTRGLRVGDRVGKLKRLYPGAIKGSSGWAIVYSLHSVVAEGSRLDILTARVKAGRVASFKLWFGGAGD